MFTVECPRAFAFVAPNLIIGFRNVPCLLAVIELPVLVDKSLPSTQRLKLCARQHEPHGHVEVPSAGNHQATDKLDGGANDSWF